MKFVSRHHSKRNTQIKREILGLDVLRFLAALMVLAFHACFFGFRANEQVLRVLLGSTYIAEVAGTTTDFGWVGVEIFFVISGFIIAYSAEGATAIGFLRSRFLRLMPCVWFASLMCLPMAYFLERHPISHIAKLFIKSIALYPRGPWIEGVLWTLIVEAAFYAGIFLLILKRWFRHIDIVASCIGMYSAGFWIVEGVMMRSQRYRPLARHMADWSWSPSAQVSLVHHGIYFAIGIGLWLRLIKRRRGMTFLLSPLMLLGSYFEIASVSNGYFEQTLVPQNSLVPFLVCVGSIGFIIVAVSQTARVDQYCRAVAENLPIRLRWFGRMTYPLYLLHVPAVILTIACIPASLGPTFRWTSGVIAALLIAAIFAAYIEPWLKKRLSNALERIA